MSDLAGKAKDALSSDKGEKVSDAAIDKGSNAADKATGGGHTEQLDTAKNAVDKKVGD